ncbi:nucleotidyltransferase family protein [Marinomonas mediterranea]|uniref:nucleotidyltransferase domain-containing protein n=1 Tax=Marinomonas mediterranea TaxID=119864 RepID=UPI00234A9437|nr:nucleotidyltransferase family protein [Marinomonas mediterranea]WCN10889.1 hypothetical protein GV055_19135 [Marinomonas mediterranea]
MDQLPLFLLDLLFRPENVRQLQIDNLNEEEVSLLTRTCAQHRIGPLLSESIKKANLSVPDTLSDYLAKANKKSIQRYLAIQSELIAINKLFSENEIPLVVLKGAVISSDVYPSPHLRPMRDLDVLIERKDTKKAVQLLKDNGYTPEINLDVFDLDATKDFPNIYSPHRRCIIELHIQVLDSHPKRPDLLDVLDCKEFAKSASDILKHSKYNYHHFSDTIMLLHLAIHASYSHTFNCGPLFISDIGMLIQRNEVNWPRFWELCEEGQWTKGCLITLQIVELYWSNVTIDWPTSQDSFTHNLNLSSIAALSLQNLEYKEGIGLRKNIATQHWFIYALKKLIIPKANLARAYNIEVTSWKLYLFYIIRPFNRLMSFFRTKNDPDTKTSVQVHTYLESKD